MMKNKMKIMTVLAAAMLFANLGMADINDDMASAAILVSQSNHSEAQTAYEKVITDYPDGDVNTLAIAQNGIGSALRSMNQFSESQAAYEKIIVNYPNASVNILSSSQLFVGDTIYNQKEYVKAQASFEKAIVDYPTADESILFSLHKGRGNSLGAQGKHAEAQAAYEKAISVTSSMWRRSEGKTSSLLSLFRQGVETGIVLEYAKKDDILLSPVLTTYQVKYGVDKILSSGTLEEIFSIITSEDKIKPMEFNEAIAARVTLDCQKNIKKILRAEGKTFIGEIGKTNITEKLSVVIAALNAPSLEGLEAAFISCGGSITPLDRTYIKAHGKEVAGKIMDGDFEPDPVKYLPHVYIALGFDKFQEWMIVYNEGGTFAWPE